MIFKIKMINNDKQFIIMTVGHIGSGKTTLARKIEDHFLINRINNDTIREYMINNIKCYNNINYSYQTETTKMNKSVKTIKNTIIKDLISFGESIILDAGHIHSNSRRKAFENKKYTQKNVTTIIIRCNIKEKDLLKRLEDRDIKSKNSTKWKQYYLETKQYQLEEIKETEADYTLYYDQNNISEILSKLESILQ